MRSRGYGTGYNSRSRSSRSASRGRPSSSSGYSNTHVNALLLQARRRAYIGGSIGRYGNTGKQRAIRGSNQRGALVRNRYGQYRVESNSGNFGIKGHRQAVKSKLRPSTSGAPYQTNTLRRAQSAGRTRSNQPVYWGANKGKGSSSSNSNSNSSGKQQQAYYPGGATKSRRPQSAGAVRKTSGPVMATKQFYGANSLAKKVTTKNAINRTGGRANVKSQNTTTPSNASMEKTVSTTLSVASQNTRSNPNAPIMKGSPSDTSTSGNNATANGKSSTTGNTTNNMKNTNNGVENVDPKGFEEMRDANRKLAERNAKLRDELQQLREQQAKMVQSGTADNNKKTSDAKSSKGNTDNREVYQPGRHANTITKSLKGGNKGSARVEYKSASKNSSGSSGVKNGRPQSAGPSSRGKLHAQGSPRNAVNVQREVAARNTYSRSGRPQSAGAKRSNSNVKKTNTRPEMRPGSAARRREQANAGGRTKLARPGTAPARRPDNAASIKKMVSDAAQQNQATDEQTRIRSIVSAETWDGRGRSDMYHFGKVLGTGSFGVVRLVLHKMTNTKIAVKTYDKRKIRDAAQLKRVQQEIRLMARTNHPNIVRLYETLESVHRVHLVMEYASGGNLCSYVKLKKRLDETEARAIFQQLSSAIAYLHSLNIVHRDIKLENILIDGRRNIKITDFGFSVYVVDKKLKIFCGTPSYMPPEIVMRREYYGPPVDCWSLGVLLYAMLCGCFPFTANSYPNLYKKIARGQWRKANFMSHAVSDLLRRMMTVDATKRITMKQACRHQWSRGGNAYVPLNPSQCSHLVSDNPADDLAKNDIVENMKNLGYRHQAIAESILGRKKNHVSTTFYLLAEKHGPAPLGPKSANGISVYSSSSGSSSSSSSSRPGTAGSSRQEVRASGFKPGARPSSSSGVRTAKLLSELKKNAK